MLALLRDGARGAKSLWTAAGASPLLSRLPGHLRGSVPGLPTPWSAPSASSRASGLPLAQQERRHATFLVRRTATLLPHLRSALTPLSSEPLLGPASQQVRAAGRAGGFKRKKKASRPRTVQQKGLGKRMEFYWPRHNSHRTRVPMYENSRRHVIWDHSKRKWMVMWYRHGIQVFRSFSGRGGKFEQGRACAILFYKQLQNAGKLGRPKPDQCRSGVRGVYFDKEERAWVARWSDCGLKKYAVYGTQELGFQDAYREAVRTRVQSIRQKHQFVFQRTRWKGRRRPLGQSQT